MKKIFIIVFFISAMCGFAFAQSRFPEFEKAKKIKMLESTREDVKKIFPEYDADDDDTALFSTENATLKVTFSEGGCKEDYEFWNVPQWVATSVLIVLEKRFKPSDFNFNFADFKKENTDEEYPKDYDYHNENLGILFKIYDGRISRVFFYPPKSKTGFLCSNESTSGYFSGEETLAETVFQDMNIDYNLPPNVDKLTLSKTEIVVSCSNVKGTNNSCSASKPEVTVKIEATDPENDVLTYEYTVSGGKIIGQGYNVVWDLSGVEPGNYEIKVGVNDGGGICGATKTEMLVVKECPDCKSK